MAEKPIDPAPAQIQRFAIALLQAVHDVKHETAGLIRIEHFWDSDSIIVPIRGFRAFETQNDNTSPENLLIQSLLAAGMLGQVRLTAAHRSELLALVDGWSTEPRDTDERFREDSQRFLRRQEINILPWTQIAASIDGAGNADRELKELTSRSGTYFAFLESVAGHWRTRWNRLVEEQQIVNLAPSGSALSDLMMDSRFDTFAQSIAAARHRPRPLATAIDAAALVEIARLNDASREGAGTYPRFFTSSPSLKRAFRESVTIRRALSFSYSSLLSSRVDTVWRDSDYYFLRASIPSLMRQGISVQNDGPSINELESLAYAMAGLIDKGKILDSASMRVIQRDAEPLIEAIRRFEEMGMAHIWLSVDFRELVTHLYEGLSETLPQNQSSETRQRAGRNLARLSREVQGEAQDFGLALEMAGAIQDAGSAIVTSRGDPCMSLSSDLGGVRWDVTPSAETDRICFGDRVLDGALASHLFTIDAIKSNVDEAERACALLLAFDDFLLVSKLVNALSPNADSDRLRLMSQVARIHSSPEAPSRAEFNLLTVTFSSLESTRQDALVLGFALAAFSLWQKGLGATRESTPPRVDDIFMWSFNEVEKRVSEFHGLRRDFALNHLIYVATCGGINPTGMAAWVAEFDPLARRSDNHRFLDTLAWRILHMSRSSAGSDGMALAGIQDAVRLLGRALDLAPFDGTVASHLHIAREMLERSSRVT